MIGKTFAASTRRKWLTRDTVAVKDANTGKEFEWCNIPSQVQRGLPKAFGELEDVESLVSSDTKRWFAF